MSHPFRASLAALTLAIAAVASATSQTPQTPADLLADAATKIGIDPKLAPAFHLKAHFDTFNPEGKPDGSGTFEEFSDGKDRLLTRTTFRGKEYRVWTIPSLHTSGSPLRQAFFANQLVEALVHPIPTGNALSGVVLSHKVTQLGSITMDCVKSLPVLALPKGPTNPHAPEPSLSEEHNYCVSTDQHLLRLAAAFPNLNFVYNQFESFAGRQVPQSISLNMQKTLRGKIILDSVETWLPDDSIFSPPAGSSNLPSPSGAPGRVTGGVILSTTAPIFPPMANYYQIKGRVVLAVTITPDGKVADPQMIESPSSVLTDAAIESVTQWRYKPFLYNGTPVSFNTLVTISF